jgi:hypothetical protein
MTNREARAARAGERRSWQEAITGREHKASVKFNGVLIKSRRGALLPGGYYHLGYWGYPHDRV